MSLDRSSCVFDTRSCSKTRRGKVCFKVHELEICLENNFLKYIYDYKKTSNKANAQVEIYDHYLQYSPTMTRFPLLKIRKLINKAKANVLSF